MRHVIFGRSVNHNNSILDKVIILRFEICTSHIFHNGVHSQFNLRHPDISFKKFKLQKLTIMMCTNTMMYYRMNIILQHSDVKLKFYSLELNEASSRRVQNEVHKKQFQYESKVCAYQSLFIYFEKIGCYK